MSARPAQDIDAANIVGHFIDGCDVADSNRPEPVTNPATGEVTRHVAMASRQTAEEAIAAADAAFPAWRDTPPIKRARIMFRFKQLLEEHADEIVAAITDEHGKVLDDAMGEFIRGVEVVEYACGIPELLKGEHSKNVGPNIDSWAEHQPLGVVAGITPFNFPAMVPMWMYPMAIACGNTFVLKPSEKDPTAPLLCARLLSEAGLPDGVFNLVNGDKEAVDTLLSDERVQAVSFVGSTSVAEYIYTTGTANGKRVQALGGAKNHAVVMPDADIDNAVSALMGAAYGSCGERCMAISVAVCVGDETADTVVSKFQERIAELKVGNGTDTGNDMGPLVTKAHYDKVRSYVDLGVEEGADLVIDGRHLQRGNLRACAMRRSHEVGRRSDAADRRTRVRQRHVHFHPRRRGGALLRRQDQGRHGRHQRAAAGTGGLPELRRLEAFPVRRSLRLWARQREVLYAPQDHHAALALGRRPRKGAVHLPEQPVSLRGWRIRRDS
jgi:malonate-semialdehyde dehydrogenase (acetylating)/methylmalonate-semialdehyde dehydrogenase